MVKLVKYAKCRSYAGRVAFCFGMRGGLTTLLYAMEQTFSCCQVIREFIVRDDRYVSFLELFF